MPSTFKSGDTPGKIAAALTGDWGDWRNLTYVLPDGTVVEGSELDPTQVAVGTVAYAPDESPSADSTSGTSTKKTTEQDAGGGVTTKKTTLKAENTALTGVGADDDNPDTPDLKILTSEEMKWFFDKQSGKWYVEYGLPNSDRNVVFEAEPDQMDALFGTGQRPTDYKNRTLSQLTQRSGSTFAGNVAEIEGTGRFEDEVNRVTTLALDEGRLPRWAKDSGEALDIIYTAQAEGKSNDWVLDQLAKTPEFKARFPKVEQFASSNNLSLVEGIQGYLEMEAGVNKAIQSSGFGRIEATPEMVSNLLNNGHSLKAVQQTVAGFKRMREFRPAFTAFNQVLEERGMDTLSSLSDMFKFVQGKAPAAIYDIWEQSSIQEAASQAGLGDVFSVGEAIDLAYKGDFTLETATQGMQKAAELLLRMRHEVDAGKFGLDHEELIDISLGTAPRSGRSQADIFENINRAVLAAQGNLQKKASPFKSFSEGGTPQAASLGNLRQQS